MSGLLKSELVGTGPQRREQRIFGTAKAPARRRWMLTEMRLRSRCELHTFPLGTSNIVAHKCPPKTEPHVARQLPSSGSMRANGDNGACNRSIVVCGWSLRLSSGVCSLSTHAPGSNQSKSFVISYLLLAERVGFEPQPDPLDSVSYRFYNSRIAVDASLPVAHCTTLHAQSSDKPRVVCRHGTRRRRPSQGHRGENRVTSSRSAAILEHAR